MAMDQCVVLDGEELKELTSLSFIDNRQKDSRSTKPHWPIFHWIVFDAGDGRLR